MTETLQRRDFLKLSGSFILSSSFLTSHELSSDYQIPDITEFVRSVENGEKDQIVGVYSPRKLALKVVLQPPEDLNFVSKEKGSVTLFSRVVTRNSFGFLAHNYLSGKEFFELSKKDRVILVFGDGRLNRYMVNNSYSYEVLDRTYFLDLQTREAKSVKEVFDLVYAKENTVTFQTCIEQNGDPYWGRYFVLAKKLPIRKALRGHRPRGYTVPRTWDLSSKEEF